MIYPTCSVEAEEAKLKDMHGVCAFAQRVV